MLRQLSLENLEFLDIGIVSEAFNQQVKRVALDCLDRPACTDPRKVTLEVNIRPVDEQTTCEHVDVQIKIKSAIPEYRTSRYDMKVRANGTFVFSEDSPDSVDQTTFFDNEEKQQ